MNHFEKKFEQKTGLNFQVFYKEHKPKLTWYLSKWTGDLEVAEDFADEAFIKALTSIDGYNVEKAQPQTWLYTIAINFVKKDYQDKQKMPSISMDRELANEATMSMFLPYDDGRKRQEKDAEDKAKAEIARDAIYSMPDKHYKYRRVLILRELKNYSYNEIADKLELNLSTVKSQIKQGRALIAKKIEKKIAYIDEHGLK
ncbi:MAG: RNA polymerase sigma factor [Candidatus Muirbacterium halophilum]|nr:RNA polymerase sigma factor [Candidatus Muirbacterium halophilum]